MKGSLLVPSDEGQRVTRDPLSVVVVYENPAAKDQASLFYQMMEQEFGDDFCFDCVYWGTEALAHEPAAVAQDATEADLVLVAGGPQPGRTAFFPEIANWLRAIRSARHSPFSLVCLTEDPLLSSDPIHADFQQVAGHFSMIYFPKSPTTAAETQARPMASAVVLSPVLMTRLVRTDPHPTGGIND